MEVGTNSWPFIFLVDRVQFYYKKGKEVKNYKTISIEVILRGEFLWKTQINF